MHEKTESAYVNAMAAAKWPTRYFAADSMSGPSRTLFFIGYPTFTAWEKDNQDTEKNATLSAAMDRAAVADGDLLTEYDSSVYVYRESASLRANSIPIAKMRYFEIQTIKVRPGHGKEWEELMKGYKADYEKAAPDMKWALFDSAYGADNGGLHIIIIPLQSLSDVEANFMNHSKFESTIGEAEMKRLRGLAASCLESEQVNLFRFNPKLSYPRDEWIKEDPGFWQPKPAVPPAP
jgi:hypothetical protein